VCVFHATGIGGVESPSLNPPSPAAAAAACWSNASCAVGVEVVVVEIGIEVSTPPVVVLYVVLLSMIPSPPFVLVPWAVVGVVFFQLVTPVVVVEC